MLVILVVPYLLDDLIEKAVEKLVRALLHNLVDECTWCNGTLISWILEMNT
jgi:hypothetical protein